MRLKTMTSIAVLAISSAALAQVTTQPTSPMSGNNMSMPMNTTMPDSTMPDVTTPDTMPMNGTTTNDASPSDSTTSNSMMPPR